MALINCKECNKEVSSKAEKCPHCGCKLKEKMGGCMSVIVFVIAILIISGMLADFAETDEANQNNTDNQSKIPSYTYKPTSWRLSENTSKITGRKVRNLYITSNDIATGWLSKYRPILNFRCSKRLEMFLQMGMQIRSNGMDSNYNSKNYVTLRIGKRKARRYRVKKSTDNKAVFFTAARSKLRQMLKANIVYAQYTPFNSNPVTVGFNTNELKSLVSSLPRRCK